MAGRMVPVGRLQVATPASMALAIRQSTEAQAAVDERIAPVAAAVVAQNETIVASAVAAVQTEMSRRRIAQYAPMDTPASGMGISPTGAAADTVIRVALLPEGGPNRFLVRNDAGQQFIRVRTADGTTDLLLSDFSLAYVAEKLGVGGASARWDGGTTEWWTDMVYEDKPNNRVLIACMDKDGWHWILECRPGAPIRGVRIVQTVADDHNLGGLLVLPDGSLLYVFNYHNQRYSNEGILGDSDGSIDSLARNPIFVIPGGGQISYNQLVLREKISTTAKAEVYVGVRRDVESWGMIPITIDLVARTITSSAYQGFFTSPGQQCYTHIGPSFKNAQGQQCVPLLTGYNPEKVRRLKPDFYRYTLNVETGAITYANDSSVGQLGTPRSYADFTPAIDPVSNPDTWGRRMFYGTRGSLLYAEGLLATPDDWTYYVALFDPDGTYNRHGFGRAGKRFGNRVDSNYLFGMGMRFSSDGREICLGRENNGTYTLESYKLDRDGVWQQKILYTSTTLPAIRPYHAGSMGWLFNEVISYPADGYIGAVTNLRFIMEGARL